MEELFEYLELLRARMEFAEMFYGFRMNYIPLYINDDIIVLDKNDGKIKRLSTKQELNKDELRKYLPKIKKNIESGFVDLLLTMNFHSIQTPED
ncbi:hypothetical protein PFDSM3638_06365 [Pyrococcus furiosus DSM 3638]|uniref:Uncharacterized protein n=3 Tax=Pyrococcus furiosus TaxID=2261 RepID=Q8U1D3_PYRFU|nr:hypothetical protein [Pyrococcus furiosus]AAL81400.1 hypothetical protein PF1276 [Pyrococcus furiosus DSM 3638]AFN04060.1 hypothetical protein PFC_05595 [Pyrococcus furiosus COM1]QEK78918.1 hypothetical protein PFDSM3638_06365 [Pyrococcus furiosus DSM 3638]